jgi:DNA-binding GntR family transcriptional regulator
MLLGVTNYIVIVISPLNALMQDQVAKLNDQGISACIIQGHSKNTTVTNKKLEIDGYKLHRLDRLYKKGGGVCAYVRKNIKSSVIKELTQISDTSFHQLWIN